MRKPFREGKLLRRRRDDIVTKLSKKIGENLVYIPAVIVKLNYSKLHLLQVAPTRVPDVGMALGNGSRCVGKHATDAQARMAGIAWKKGFKEGNLTSSGEPKTKSR